MRTHRPPGRLVLPALCAAGSFVLACAGGDGVPEPWSRREGDHGIVVGDEGPGVSGQPRPGEEPRGAAVPTTTTRTTEPAPPDLPPIDRAYPEVIETRRIAACPEGTELKLDDRAGEQFCVLAGTDVRHGPYLRLYGNGRVHDAGPYRGGQRHGEWSEFHRSGTLAGTWQWTDGQPGGRVDR